jgi:conjugative transfer region protein (TIGR03750 family)
MAESKHEEPDILADGLDIEPPIFRGLSNSELGLLIKLAALFWIPVCFLIAGLLGYLMMGAGAVLLMVLLTVVVGGTVFQRIKRGRPDYYYQHYMMLRKKKQRTDPKQIIKHTGTWGLGRTDET